MLNVLKVVIWTYHGRHSLLSRGPLIQAKIKPSTRLFLSEQSNNSVIQNIHNYKNQALVFQTMVKNSSKIMNQNEPFTPSMLG